MNLSPHFTLAELTQSQIGARNGFDNTPNDFEIQNLQRLAALLEKVRIAVGNKPINVNSGFRSKQVNDAVGSKDSSQHRTGCAADFHVVGMTPREVVEACIDAKVPFDQIILEYDQWVHISVPSIPDAKPRNSRLIIDLLGTRTFS